VRCDGTGDGSPWRRPNGKRPPTNDWLSIGGCATKQAGTPAGQVALASWLPEHGLPAESRAHWVPGAQGPAEKRRGAKALGVQWYHGQLLTAAQLKEAQQAHTNQGRAATLKTERQSMDRWVAPVANWRRALKQGDAGVRESLAP